MQLEKLNSTLFICFVIVLVNMDKVNDLINEGVDFVEEVSLCFYINEQDEICHICGDGGDLILCDGGCERAFHLECLHLHKVPDDEKWLCPSCRIKQSKADHKPVEVKPADDESDEYFEIKNEQVKTKKKIKSNKKEADENYGGKQQNRVCLTERDYSHVQGRLVECPVEGCIAKSSTRTSLLSHAYFSLI